MDQPDDTPEFDVDAVQVPWLADAAPMAGRAKEPYFRGPVPWTWLRAAIGLGESAVATGLAIWHLRALRTNSTFVASLYQLRKWTGLSEKATRGGLHRLEAGGLVRVDRPAGRSPVITLLEASVTLLPTINPKHRQQ